MKTIILTLVLFFLHLTNISAQWEIINDGSDLKGFLNTIDFVNEEVGWIGGNQMTLLKTNDGGENWNTINISDSISFKHIDFITESIGWAVCGSYWGEGGSICKSIDGGFSWITQLPDFGFSSLYVIDENNVYAVGGNTIFKTLNGGTNWIDISPNLPDRNYNSIWFQDSQTGIVTGYYDDGTNEKGIILKTTNGGTNWTETIVNEFSSICDLQFLNSNNGYFRAHTDSTGIIGKTTDMFTSWNVVTQVNNFYQSLGNAIKSFHFFDNNNAYAIMDDSISYYNVMKTVDGGNNWYKLTSETKGLPLGKIYFNKENRGVLLSAPLHGRGGNYSFPVFFRTDDYGNNWTIINFNIPITEVSFFDLDRGFIGAIYPAGIHYSGIGVIFKSLNQGNIWEIKFYIEAPLKNYFLLNYQDAYLLIPQTRGYIPIRIFKTSDFGDSWILKFETQENLFDANFIYFLNDQVGFVVGRYWTSNEEGATILKTSDGGDNWNFEWFFPNTVGYAYNLNSIHFSNSTGWSVGESGMILKYTLQTGWVKQTSVTDLPLNKVFFSDENHGWITGGYQNENNFQNILLKTTNGGVNWITVPNIPYLFRDIAFVDNNLGWAIGYDSSGIGGILKSTDGGLTWEINTGNLPAKLNALHIKDNYGWAVGENGLILRTTDAGAVWVEDESDNSLPTEFVLEQNFPNPFNPSTKISWQSPVGSRQILKVFDVLGNTIATLVDEYKAAGKYEVEFGIHSGEGRDLSSGIYFYQLKAGDHISTKKMLLLK